MKDISKKIYGISQNHYWKKWFLFIFAFGALLYDVYFFWPTYPYAKIGYALVMLIRYGSVLMLLFFQIGIIKGRLRVNTINTIIILLGIFSLLETHLLGKNGLTLIKLKDILLIVDLFLLSTLSEESKSNIFEFMLKTFAIIILPSLCYFIFTRVLKIELPYTVLYSYLESKEIRMIRYEWRPIGLIIRSFSPYQSVIPRYCGIFDEAGVIGTLSAFFLAASIYSQRINMKWKILLIIEGMFSLSMAFYLLFAVIIIIYAYDHGFFKFVFFLSFLLLFFILFINWDLSKYPLLEHLQNRIDLSSIMLVKNNRNSDRLNKDFDKLFENGGYPLLLGYGVEASKDDSGTGGSSSYKRLLYDHGLFGAFLYLSIFLFPFCDKKYRKREALTFFIVFFLSIYQRPYVKNHQIIVMFFSALSHIYYNCSIKINKKINIKKMVSNL